MSWTLVPQHHYHHPAIIYYVSRHIDNGFKEGRDLRKEILGQVDDPEDKTMKRSVRVTASKSVKQWLLNWKWKQMEKCRNDSQIDMVWASTMSLQYIISETLLKGTARINPCR